MRLELGVRETMTDQGHRLLEDIERGVVSLSGAGVHTEAYRGILEDVQTFRIACAAVHEFAPLAETLVHFEALVAAAGEGKVPFDSKVGGVFLHVVSTFRHALNTLGSSSRTAQMLPRIFQDLNRVMGALLLKASQTQDAPQAGAPPASVPAGPSQAVLDEYCEMFLRDESGVFVEILEHSQRLAAGVGVAVSQEVTDTLFRLVHTVKGNAMALGFEGMGAYAHALEDVLHLLRVGRLQPDAEVARMLVCAADNLKCILNDCRQGSLDSIGIEAKVAELRTFAAQQPLEHIMPQQRATSKKQPAPTPAVSAGKDQNLYFFKATIGGRLFMIPCAAVAEVLRKPQVMAIPGGRHGWLGVIRAGGLLVPLIDPNALLESAFEHSLNRIPPWTAVLTSENSRFCIPLDDVGEVIELPYGIAEKQSSTAPNSTVLDIPSMLKKIG